MRQSYQQLFKHKANADHKHTRPIIDIRVEACTHFEVLIGSDGGVIGYREGRGVENKHDIGGRGAGNMLSHAAIWFNVSILHTHLFQFIHFLKLFLFLELIIKAWKIRLCYF